MEGKTVFVTGGTGLLGSHLLFSLAEKKERIRATYRQQKKLSLVRKVFSYYSDNPDLLLNEIEWVESDLSDYDNLKSLVTGCKQVYHCAATVSYESSARDALIRSNSELTSRIVRACLETGVEKLCHVSSVATVETSENQGLIDESENWIDSVYHNAYAISKHLSEMEVWNGVKKGLNVVIVNPSIILGPGFWDSGSSLFFSRIARGMLFYTGGVKGYVDVRDVVKSMITLMNSPVKGERFIISSENISFREFFSTIAHSMKALKPFIFVPEFLSAPAAAIVKLISRIRGKEGAVTPEIIHSAFSKVYYDNRKIREATGIAFIPVRQSVEDTARIYRVEKQNKK